MLKKEKTNQNINRDKHYNTTDTLPNFLGKMMHGSSYFSQGEWVVGRGGPLWLWTMNQVPVLPVQTNLIATFLLKLQRGSGPQVPSGSKYVTSFVKNLACSRDTFDDSFPPLHPVLCCSFGLQSSGLSTLLILSYISSSAYTSIFLHSVSWRVVQIQLRDMSTPTQFFL